MRSRWRPFAIVALAGSLLGASATAQAPGRPGPEIPGPEAQTPLAWAKTAARGVLDLCREDAPDAAAVADHGEVWGWPSFVPYLEHPDGYERQAGGQSRRSYAVGEVTAEVEVTVQSGVVTSAAPAKIAYFRCDVAANQPIGPELEAYFTQLYGPAIKTDQGEVWLVGDAKGAAPDGDEATLAAVSAAGAGASGERILLFHELDREQAKITEFVGAPAN